jgi:hypothetical protein
MVTIPTEYLRYEFTTESGGRAVIGTPKDIEAKELRQMVMYLEMLISERMED